ncbi:MAG: hypothetical protein AAF515_19045 [Pseudomonadota bacterium]
MAMGSDTSLQQMPPRGSSQDRRNATLHRAQTRLIIGALAGAACGGVIGFAIANASIGVGIGLGLGIAFGFLFAG